MKSIKFNSNNSSISAAFIDSFNNKLKSQGKSVERYSIHISPEGKTSIKLYF